MMIALATILLLVTLLALFIRWLATAPLARTLSTAIDGWADSVQGREPDQLP